MSLASKLPYNHPFAGGYPGLGSQPLPGDSDALTYLGAVAAADGAGVEVSVAMSIDGFIRDCKAAGIFDAIKASCILCGARTLSGALVPLAGTAPTSNGFVSGDYSRTAGLKGDGTSYLDSERADTDDGQNDHHIVFHSTAGDPSIGEYPIGVRNGASPNIYTIAGYDFWSRSASSSPDPAVIATGTYGLSRSSSGSFRHIRASGSVLSTSVASSATTSGGNHFVFGINVGGVASFHTSATIAFYSIGSSLGTDPATGLADLDTAVSNLVTAIGNAL